MPELKGPAVTYVKHCTFAQTTIPQILPITIPQEGFQFPDSSDSHRNVKVISLKK